MKAIYLDNAATTKIDPKVLAVMLPYLQEDFANASSIHGLGNKSAVAVMAARVKVATFLGCLPEEVIFTGGATESDNLAILGLIKAIVGANIDLKPHVIVSAIEHEAVLEPAQELKRQGLVELTILPVNNAGLVELAELKKSIKPNTVLVSIMLANNEIGTIEPITEIGSLIEQLNGARSQKIYFHTDATQAPTYVDCDVKKLKVDLLSMSAHKIYGPKGVGALYIKRGTPLKSLVYGGGQEKKIRSGTYNVAGIVGFGAAIELISNKKTRSKEIKEIKNLRDYLIKSLKKISRAKLNGDVKNRLANNINFVFPGVEGESIVLMLSQKGIMASTGSACSSGSLDPSHVLLAIGLPAEIAHGSLRLTLGRFTTKKELDALIKALPPIIEKLRQMSPLKLK